MTDQEHAVRFLVVFSPFRHQRVLVGERFEKHLGDQTAQVPFAVDAHIRIFHQEGGADARGRLHLFLNKVLIQKAHGVQVEFFTDFSHRHSQSYGVADVFLGYVFSLKAGQQFRFLFFHLALLDFFPNLHQV